MRADRVNTEAQVLLDAKRAMGRGSRSFSAATRLFGRDTRHSARLLYAWCRHCDDVIDGQVGGFAAPLSAVPPGAALNFAAPATSPLQALTQLEQRTRIAFGTEALADPVFAGLRMVSQRHNLPLRYPLDHLAGFRMDVQGREYTTLPELLEYCYHVAGVVGIMMAAVMDVRAPATLDRACDLGLAFQLTNIARDVVEDARVGRIYLPRQWLVEAGLSPSSIGQPKHRLALAGVVARLLEAAEPYYASAAAGISALPHRSAWAIATARAVYRDIGTELRDRGAGAWDRRVSTTRSRKLQLMLHAGIQAMRRPGVLSPRPDGLWTRPGQPQL